MNARGASFDHLIGDGQHAWGDGEAKRSRGLEIDHELELRWQQNRQITRLLAFEDASGMVMSLFQLFSAFGDVLEKFGDRPVRELDIGGLGRRGGKMALQ